MPDETPIPPVTQPTPAPPAVPAGPTINIAAEFGTAKRNLPPARIVLIAIAGVLIVVAIGSFLKRAKPQASGTLDNIAAVEIPGQGSTMVALTFTLHNTSETLLKVRSPQGTLKTASGEDTADAVSAVDFDRYFQAFPDLKKGALPALPPETKIPVGETISRTIIVVFPKTLDAFNQRQSVSAVVWLYDLTVPIVMTK